MSRVLVVEDEPAIAELIALNLRHSGFDVVVAGTADEAQAEIDRVLPNLVLLDWMLPGQSGLSLAKRWRSDARTRELPIIMLTARAEEVDKLQAICVICGESAARTQRLINGEPAAYNDPIVLVGAAEVYEARCRHCH